MSTAAAITPPDALPPLAADDLLTARRHLAGHAVATPLLESPALSRMAGRRVLVKAETLQHTGSFKFRGAHHFISRLDETARRGGVVAYSSGNHAQAVAYAAERFGIAATIVMPADCPAVKVEGTRRWGAEVVFYDRRADDREAMAKALCAERGATLIPPYNHPWIIAGQGTLALEIAEQTEAHGITPDLLIVPTSGGGMLAGCALAVAERLPGCRVYAAEPADYADAAASIRDGVIRSNAPDTPASLCDSLMAKHLGEVPFPLIRRHVGGSFPVTDAEVLRAMKAAFGHLKLVAEPGGAAALAAALFAPLPEAARTVCVVLSGANVDAATFCRAIAG